MMIFCVIGMTKAGFEPSKWNVEDCSDGSNVSACSGSQ